MNPNPEFMRRAIALATHNVQAVAGGPFAAVIVKDGVIVGEGANSVTATNDPTAHGEVMAIRDACARLGVFSLEGCEMYTSCEPCPMCYSTAYWARVSKIYYAAAWTDYADLFDDSNISIDMKKSYPERAVPVSPLLREEAQQVWLEFRKMPDGAKY
jgi:guanine deaminase